MSAIDFPASPSNGQVYSINGKTWVYSTSLSSWLGANSETSITSAAVTFNYGTGEDGAAVLDGTNTFSWASKSSNVYTLTRSVMLSSLQIDSGKTLITAGYAVYVSGTFTNNGIFGAPGNDATGTGTAGVGTATGVYGGGGAGGTTNNGVDPANCLGGNAGNTGSSTENAARGAQTASPPSAANGGTALAASIVAAYLGRNNSGTLFNGGAGGHGGPGTSGVLVASPGGGGGGVAALFARIIAGSGTITAKGGKGWQPGNIVLGAGAAGGGGVIICITSTADWQSLNTVTVAGGDQAINPLDAARNGTAGSAGRIMEWIM